MLTKELMNKRTDGPQLIEFVPMIQKSIRNTLWISKVKKLKHLKGGFHIQTEQVKETYDFTTLYCSPLSFSPL